MPLVRIVEVARGWPVMQLLSWRVTHATAAVGGLAVLAATAWPLTFDGLYTAPSSGMVILLIGSAVLFGGIGGLVEGAAYRLGHRVVAWLALVVASFPAFVMPALSMGRWGDFDSPVETTDLFLPFAGWLLYVAVITLVSWATARTRKGVSAGRGSVREQRVRTNSQTDYQ